MISPILIVLAPRSVDANGFFEATKKQTEVIFSQKVRERNSEKAEAALLLAHYGIAPAGPFD